MPGIVVRAAAVCSVLLLWVSVPALADFEAGQRAWDAGDPVEALAQWSIGAEEGDPRAMLALGRLYREGLGVLQDFVEAYKWFNLAASRGNAEAASERNELSASMTPEQLAEGQSLARAWRPGAGQGSGPAEPAPPPPETASPPPPPPDAIREAQSLLSALGYQPGPADGIWGRRSAEAYQSFLRDAGLARADVLTPDALRTMQRIAAGRRRAEDPVSVDDGQVTQNATGPAPTEPARQALRPDILIRLVQAGDIDGVAVALEAGAGVHINLHDDQGLDGADARREKG